MKRWKMWKMRWEPDEDIQETAGLEEEVPSDEEEDHSP
jgi:hypothetical protein